MSIFTEKTITVVDMIDLQDFIAEQYNLDEFEILGAPNDSTHNYNITNAILSKYDQNELTEILENKSTEYIMVELILNDLCNKGIINEGTYIMYVCW